MKNLARILIGSLIVVTAAGCGGSSGSSSSATTSSPATSAVQVSTRSIPGLGTVLVDAQGKTLYMFARDKQSKVTCVGACAAVWPPLKIATGQKAVATAQAKSSLLGSDADPSGGHVVTYNGWPLYTYAADTSPGQATGQALNLNGGLWYVLTPSGAINHTKLGAGGGTSTSSGY